MAVNKKAYVRTLEVFIAFAITFTFLIYVIGHLTNAPEMEKAEIFILNNFEQRPDFRNCVFDNNATCIESMIDTSISEEYDYRITVNDASFTRDSTLFTDSLYLTGDSASEPYHVRLYYWKKGG